MNRISNFVLTKAYENFMTGITTALSPIEKLRREEEVRKKYQDEIALHMARGMKREDVVGIIGPPDFSNVEMYTQITIATGVGTRLRGAIALYKDGQQLECIRHILLALQSICSVLEWHDAARYLAEQNTNLNAMREKKAA